MVDLHSSAMIIDFGFSLPKDKANEHITTVGHQNYQPRELYCALRKTWRSDVYAFGLLTLEVRLVVLSSRFRRSPPLLTDLRSEDFNRSKGL